MARIYRLQALICINNFFCNLSFAATQPFCDALIFGVPSYSDCTIAVSKMPYATDSRESSPGLSHSLFSEPQVLLPPFKSVSNRYRPMPINQLPKIWRTSR